MIAVVVLASGYSLRMGRSKLTLQLEGASLLHRAIRAATGATRVGRCLIVLRPEDAHLVHESGVSCSPSRGPDMETGDRASGPPVEVIVNRHAAEGQSASIRLATDRLAADPRCQAIVFSVVDQPFLHPPVFDALADAWAAGLGEIVVSTYAGQRGNPALFGRTFFTHLQQLTGDLGGREVIRRHPEALHEVAMPDPEGGRDIDTWEDYLQARHELQARRERGG